MKDPQVNAKSTPAFDLGARLFKLRLDLILVAVVAAIGFSRLSGFDVSAVVDQIRPIHSYNMSFVTSFEPDDRKANIYTFFPTSDSHQKVVEHSIPSQVPWLMESSEGGQRIHWTADQDANHTRYDVKVITRKMQYDIDPNLEIPSVYADSELKQWLRGSEAVQVGHPEIEALWTRIKPENDRNTLQVLQSIYQYTLNQLETVPFKGTTDALTALRLGIASCNGKSRLFVALARMNNIPARLVGGMILEGREKRVSHQWVEVYIEGHWVPFGPTNGHFAQIPENYLKLYTGDHSLIRHTANIDFDYHFSITRSQVSPVFYGRFEEDGQQTSLSGIFAEMGLSPATAGVILAFPLCCLLITLLRNVVGVKTYGIFMPMLIAATCVYTGLLHGAIGFTALLLLAWSVHWLSSRMRLLKTARLALVVTVVVCAFVGLLISVESSVRTELGIMSVFPVIIIGFIADRLHQSTNESQWQDLALSIAGTAVTVVLCYLVMKSMLLQGLFVVFPELLLLIIAAQIFLGQWSGLRLSEMRRFAPLLKTNPSAVLGINSRNRDIIYAHNDNTLLRLAADKLESKKALKAHDVPIAENLAVISHRSDIDYIGETVETLDAFAIKPNQGSQGKGILVLRRDDDGQLLDSGGNLWTINRIKQHLQEILSGSFSQNGDGDVAYLEPLLREQELIQRITRGGLSDIRIIVASGRAVSAMLRLPTASSNGKANLHQGAIGVAIDLQSGKPFHLA